MGPALANMNSAGGSGPVVDDEEWDFGGDCRTERRWRRRFASKNLRLNRGGSSEPQKKNHLKCKVVNNKDVQMEEEEFVDLDFKTYFISLGVDFDDHNVHVDSQRGDDCNADVNLSEEEEDEFGGDDYLDPQYKMFLEKLREDGKSYVLEVFTSDDVPMLIKYEKVDGSYDLQDLGNVETVNACPEGENVKIDRILRSDSRKEKVKSTIVMSEGKFETITAPRSDSSGEFLETRDNLQNVSRKKRKHSVVENSVEADIEDPDSCRTSERLSKRLSPQVHHSDKYKCRCNAECNVVDDNYQAFLDCLKDEGETLVFMLEGGKKVIYENDDESSTDSEVIVMDIDPNSGENRSPLVIVTDSDSAISMHKVGTGCTGGHGNSSHSQFRERLMDILKEPYDEKEYKDLWQVVARRRPKEQDRRLRSGKEKAYVVKSLHGPSYLDQHSDFAGKIKLVKNDRPRVLNLLRGFTFWLQHVVNVGAFKPWLDESCLNVLPPM